MLPVEGEKGEKVFSPSPILGRALPTTKADHGVPVVVQWLTNPTRNYEVAGSVPALVQWVNDLALL